MIYVPVFCLTHTSQTSSNNCITFAKSELTFVKKRKERKIQRYKDGPLVSNFSANMGSE